jgi:hypothetical protein
MRAILIAGLLLVAGLSPALAECFDKMGCSDRTRFRTSDLRRMNCESLWSMRNAILFENGYCFEDDRAAETFGNAKCKVKDITRLSLNPNERSNMRTISKVQTEKGC